jgi:hypothetical protein
LQEGDAKTSVSPVACDGFAAFLPAKAVAALEHVRGTQRERSLSHGYARIKEEGRSHAQADGERIKERTKKGSNEKGTKKGSELFNRRNK